MAIRAAMIEEGLSPPCVLGGADVVLEVGAGAP
jgi:hypothetical protein